VTRKIPTAVIAVVSDALGRRYTHAQIDNFMEAAGLELSPSPAGNRQVKTRAWLQHANKSTSDPMAVLGEVIAELMEVKPWGANENEPDEDAENLRASLAKYGFAYLNDGHIVPLGATPVSETLQNIIVARDLSGLRTEFDRIYANVESDPAAAVTGSCALLESLFKTYIEEKGLEMPSEQSLKPLWKEVKKDFALDPAITKDDDLRTILTGLAAIVEGTGSLRTHKGSAHGRGKTVYKLKPRHARLAANAAFTVASFVLEAWSERGS
jgi:hypothetical protein